MRKKLSILGLTLLAAAGCSNMNNTEKDGLMGAGAGAAAGALLTRGSPFGAVVGGLFGGLIGTSIGSNQDRRDDRDKFVQGQVAAQQARQMRLDEIVQLTQQRVGDAVIINQINATGSVFALTADDINYLHQQSVSDAVVNYMISRRTRVIYAPYGPPPPPGVVYVAPAPPPPPPIGVGVVIGR